MSSGNSPVKLSSEFDIHVRFANPPADLRAAISRTKSSLFSGKFERLVLGRGSADADLLKDARTLVSLELSLAAGSLVRSIAEETNQPIEAKSDANSTLGLFRGLATFEQLWYDYEGTKYTLQGGAEINDGPSFPYRGFSFDTARNFYPVSDILRTVDAMSWVKLSVLYWHIIDSQSFPLQVAAFPELSEKGAYSASEIYTQDDVRRIVQYANERGIDVVMELDSPGHTTAIGAAHPELIACASKSPWSKYASEPPAGQLRIASPNTLAFAKTFFDSVASALPGTMMSSGGDEVNLPCWEEDEETQADLTQRNMTIADALNQFVGTVQGVIAAHGKTPFIKSDMVLTHNVAVLNDTVVVVWQTSEDAAAVAERNLRFIHQPSNYFYLVHMTSYECILLRSIRESHSGTAPTRARRFVHAQYWLLSLWHLLRSPVRASQMPLWSEQSSPENLDSIVWPRLAAAAEVFWTGATLPDGTQRVGENATSGTRALARLNELRYRLVDRGVQAIALQPKWCVLRPGECDLDS
ncbi:N-acetylhexosaminidase [Lentinus brumalis]|uniref:Beta-hexosaminidase n=1 Tax=Lentinus brumalis TaxID=2498619 RepID=A0A371CQI5_9APHY|nr:N-acetylhexosaminidase [Polyporus brumalis]